MEGSGGGRDWEREEFTGKLGKNSLLRGLAELIAEKIGKNLSDTDTTDSLGMDHGRFVWEKKSRNSQAWWEKGHTTMGGTALVK
jgi:hypothetical protein